MSVLKIKLINKNMKTEYEATFPNINKQDLRQRLSMAGAKLVRPEFLQKRVTFNLPAGQEIPGAWLRVRDEGDRITMSLKIVDGAKINDQKETCLLVESFTEAVDFLNSLGARQKAYQETYREIWHLAGAEICLDEWPYLEPLAEIEAETEEIVKTASSLLSFDYSQALFCSVATLYSRKYNLSEHIISNLTPLITFRDPNPFLENKQTKQ